MNTEFKFMARDKEDGNLYVYTVHPCYDDGHWVTDGGYCEEAIDDLDEQLLGKKLTYSDGCVKIDTSKLGVYLAVDERGNEFIFKNNPKRGVDENNLGIWVSTKNNTIRLPDGCIERLLGNNITWRDGVTILKPRIIKKRYW